MMYFFADDHFEAHPGKVLYDSLPENVRKKIVFRENDFSLLESGEWTRDCDLLILNLIATTCNLPHPGSGAEKAVRSYLERGGNVLLLHGSSAAFWQWDWWRKIVGLRWVRPGDPDQIPVSCHPVAPCTLKPLKTRHELAPFLPEVELAEDEIYINLEQVSPVMLLMETNVNGTSYPQCLETITPWGGRMVSFIPGHKPENVRKIAGHAAAILQYLEKCK